MEINNGSLIHDNRGWLFTVPALLYLFQNRAYKDAIVARLNGSKPAISVPDGGRAEFHFNSAMFTLLGRIAVMDGELTRRQVAYANLVIKLLGMTGDARQGAIDSFNRGRELKPDTLPLISALVRHIGKRSDLSILFLKIQCRAALIKGHLTLREKMLLRDVAELLGIDKPQFLQICNTLAYIPTVDPARPSGINGAGATGKSAGPTVSPEQQAYALLQVHPDVDDAEIKRAYLRMISRYHPDKLVRENLTDDALKIARQKFTDIRGAYETLCGIRNIRI